MDLTRTSPQGRHDNLATPRARCESLERRTLFAGTALYLTETTTPAGLELSIDGSPGDDRISIVAYGDTLMLANKGGWSLIVPNHFALLRVNAARGNDVVIVDGSVATDAILYGSNGDDTILGGAGDDQLFGGYGRDRMLGGAGDDTIVSIGDSVQDRVSGDGGFDSFWTDSARSELITDASADELTGGAVNRVGAFFAPASVASVDAGSADALAAASRDLGGQDLPDPKPVMWKMTYTDFSGRPLFAQAGPRPTDIKQGLIGDCYFLAPLASLAQQDPELIRQSVIELGDGTYAVRFCKNGGSVYVRVDNDLVTWTGGTTPVYAGLGTEGSMWVAVIEKAYAFFRRGEGTYGSIDRGWMTEAYAALGLTPESFARSTTKSAEVLARIKTALDAGAAMTWGTYDVPAGIPLVSSHAYFIDAVTVDADGNPVSIRLFNPWGADGAGDDGVNDGYVTITAAQAAAAFVGVVFAHV